MSTAIALPFFISPAQQLADWSATCLTKARELGRRAAAEVILPPLLVIFVLYLRFVVGATRRARNSQSTDAGWIPLLGKLHTIHDGLSVILGELRQKPVWLVQSFVLNRLPGLREDLGDIIEAIELGLNTRFRESLLHDIRTVKAKGPRG